MLKKKLTMTITLLSEAALVAIPVTLIGVYVPTVTSVHDVAKDYRIADNSDYTLTGDFHDNNTVDITVKILSDDDGVDIKINSTYQLDNKDYDVTNITITKDDTVADQITISNLDFSDCTSLQNLTIDQDVVDSIETYSFENCNSLTSLPEDFDQYISNVPDNAFKGCSSLTQVTLYGLDYIGNSAFEDCSSLTEIDFDESGLEMTSIGDNAFANCVSLQKFSFPDTILTIGYQAFLNCTSLYKVLTWNGVQTVGDSAFEGCSSVEWIHFINTDNSALTTIGTSAFKDCTSLTVVTLPSTITSLGSSAFYNCVNLATVRDLTTGFYSFVLPSTLATLADNLFYNCINLTTITIPSNITTINWWAFYNCSGITSVTISNSVTYIGSGAFYNIDESATVSIPSSYQNNISNYFNGENITYTYTTS